MEWASNRVRQVFLAHFEKLQHRRVPSSSVVLPEDPSLLFTTAGICQFKSICLGTCDPRSPLGQLKRACNFQKCIRAGGKHNDLEDVGKDPRHQTFFEMLGSWSFGDYFKKEAIEWAWALLTQEFGMSSARLYVTYFGGDEKLGLPPDHEARDIWLRFLPPQRVLPFGCMDNFWEMGDSGPCGPCSEIHYDMLGDRDASHLVNGDDATCIEIWNIVFMQFDREADGSLKPLPSKHVDTGMGLERLTSILQNKSSNYDTDLFQPIFQRIQQVTKARPYKGKFGKDDIDNIDTAYRVIADHIRTLSIAIADGYRPGNDGREYVLRRILRRAVRYGSDVLKAEDGFFCELVPVVVELMGDVYPELRKAEPRIKEVIAEEEASFGKTLVKGLERFKKMTSGLKQLTGQDAFLLWDTYGFPIDLTQQMAEERQVQVDIEGFHRAFADARQKARSARHKNGGLLLALEAEAVSQLQKLHIRPTVDAQKYFWGVNHSATIQAIFTPSGFRDELDGNIESCGLVLDSTSFYSEQGGQIFDTGTIASADCSFKVQNVQIYGGYVLHMGSLISSTSRMRVGDQVLTKVDYDRRGRVAANHTCTHLLNYALKAILGEHVDQKGSEVVPGKLKFDFSHGKPVDSKDLQSIESSVSEKIGAALQVYTQEVSLSQAKRIFGVRAVFSEAYPDPVRVVAIGKPVEDLLANPENPSWASFSTEFCGGTHLTNTGEAKKFVITSEEGISKGVRRVVAISGDEATQCIKRADDFDALLEKVSGKQEEASKEEVAALKASIEAAELPAVRKIALRERVVELQGLISKRQKALEDSNLKKAQEVIANAAAEEEWCCILRLDVKLQAKALREAVQILKNRQLAIMVFCVADERVLVCAGCTLPGVNPETVGKWLEAALEPLQGKGGGVGKHGLAQGQGIDATRVAEAIRLSRAYFDKSILLQNGFPAC